MTWANAIKAIQESTAKSMTGGIMPWSASARPMSWPAGQVRHWKKSWPLWKSRPTRSTPGYTASEEQSAASERSTSPSSRSTTCPARPPGAGRQRPPRPCPTWPPGPGAHRPIQELKEVGIAAGGMPLHANFFDGDHIRRAPVMRTGRFIIFILVFITIYSK